MQAALEISARYCGRELEHYSQCVAAKPESWQRDCHYLKMSIAQCTSAQHSHFLPPEDSFACMPAGKLDMNGCPLYPSPVGWPDGVLSPGCVPGFPGYQDFQ
ncbi:coiled-coil-helix-coiled-coil-helix domain-containing protein 5 isoform X2 [Cebus imitator]|uniref:coiled-coil-helix-coiled-coil-helix domain-containing protein 5 isoform X2 n=1 Tax=Cebus imitator TaxID=2715852 RepID=UPI000809ECFD|nr:coiled-coil-helix-coiled-coil-helix domain-containing protein 5 isoform X2 [Cebus imitator]